MFVTIEGLDGAGKDSALRLVKKAYPQARITSEPSDRWTGDMVRQCLADDETHPLTDFYLFMADRVHHIENDVRLYANDSLVVSGRYADSTRVYQPVALVNHGVFDTQEEAKDFIEQTMAPWNYEPDLTIYISISVDTALQRASQDEKYEHREFLEAVEKNYHELIESNPDRFVVIDGEQPKEFVGRDVVQAVDDLYL